LRAVLIFGNRRLLRAARKKERDGDNLGGADLVLRTVEDQFESYRRAMIFDGAMTRFRAEKELGCS